MKYPMCIIYIKDNNIDGSVVFTQELVYKTSGEGFKEQVEGENLYVTVRNNRVTRFYDSNSSMIHTVVCTPI